METYLVTYDIDDFQRLLEVIRICNDFGIRRQDAVFICRLSIADLLQFKIRLYEVIDRDHDHVMIISLCRRCSLAIETL